LSLEIKIRFANKLDFDFLNSHVHTSNEILKRKIKWQEIIVAEKDEIPIGFLQLEYLWSLVPYIALIKVLPEYQRMGISRKLLEFTESFLRQNDHQMIYSSSQFDESSPQEWHRHIGFEECGMISGINEGIGEVFFRKKI
jgi:N-acetylglutamate synthase-like GNAT family acetyltransferase